MAVPLIIPEHDTKTVGRCHCHCSAHRHRVALRLASRHIPLRALLALMPLSATRRLTVLWLICILCLPRVSWASCRTSSDIEGSVALSESPRPGHSGMGFRQTMHPTCVCCWQMLSGFEANDFKHCFTVFKCWTWLRNLSHFKRMLNRQIRGHELMDYWPFPHCDSFRATIVF